MWQDTQPRGQKQGCGNPFCVRATTHLFLSPTKMISCEFSDTFPLNQPHGAMSLGESGRQLWRAHLQAAAEEDVEFSFVFSHQGLLLQQGQVRLDIIFHFLEAMEREIRYLVVPSYEKKARETERESVCLPTYLATSLHLPVYTHTHVDMYTVRNNILFKVFYLYLFTYF